MKSDRTKIARQIKLPMSKAVEIAYKSIRQRLSRSMLVTSSIILALAFLVAIMTTESLNNGMRHWIDNRPQADDFKNLRKQRDEVDAKLKQERDEFHKTIADAPAPPQGTKPFDPKPLGDSWEGLKDLLPASGDELGTFLIARPEFVDKLKTYIADAKHLREVRSQINAPEDLRALLSSKGVPTEQAEIAANRIQTRWLIGLALLVAFVGILNAMLMSVTERFREIGTMKCLGALDSFIVKLFLIESLFQGVVGTILGLILGVVVSFGMAFLSFGTISVSQAPWNEIWFGIGVSLVVGLVLSVAGAVYPAWQAARMEPIQAMRSET